MRFFLGGVPFGCDNIGDEAILAGVVSIVRRNFEGAQITVCTAKPIQTAKLLNVEAVGLYGFRKEYPIEDLPKALKGHDVFIWSGATGLSDYPQLAVKILTTAQNCGLKTVVWGVGMDTQLNPAFFKLGGKKLALCGALSKLTLGAADFTKLFERALVSKMKKKIAEALFRCDLVVCRDFETEKMLKSCDSALPVIVGADSATIFKTPDCSTLKTLTPDTHEALFKGGQNIGLCISAQRALSDEAGLVRTLDELLQDPCRNLFFIPMNPVTDFELMKGLQAKLKRRSQSYLIGACEDFMQVISIASLCKVVVSSRLHLLILAANVGTPIVGISRGSKVDNFLNQFGLKSAGTVYDCDFAHLKNQVDGFLNNKSAFERRRAEIYDGLARRLANAEALLRGALK